MTKLQFSPDKQENSGKFVKTRHIFTEKTKKNRFANTFVLTRPKNQYKIHRYSCAKQYCGTYRGLSTGADTGNAFAV